MWIHKKHIDTMKLGSSKAQKLRSSEAQKLGSLQWGSVLASGVLLWYTIIMASFVMYCINRDRLYHSPYRFKREIPSWTCSAKYRYECPIHWSTLTLCCLLRITHYSYPVLNQFLGKWGCLSYSTCNYHASGGNNSEFVTIFPCR